MFSESFDGTDGVMADEYINNGIDPTGRWDVTSGVLKISGNYGYTDSPVFRVVTQKSDFTNFTLNAGLLKKTPAIEAYEGLQLFFRYQDQYNLYVARIRNDNSIHLKKKVNDVYYTLVHVPLPTKNDHWL